VRPRDLGFASKAVAQAVVEGGPRGTASVPELAQRVITALKGGIPTTSTTGDVLPLWKQRFGGASISNLKAQALGQRPE